MSEIRASGRATKSIIARCLSRYHAKFNVIRICDVRMLVCRITNCLFNYFRQDLRFWNPVTTPKSHITTPSDGDGSPTPQGKTLNFVQNPIFERLVIMQRGVNIQSTKFRFGPPYSQTRALRKQRSDLRVRFLAFLTLPSSLRVYFLRVRSPSQWRLHFVLAPTSCLSVCPATSIRAMTFVEDYGSRCA